MDGEAPSTSDFIIGGNSMYYVQFVGKTSDGSEIHVGTDHFNELTPAICRFEAFEAVGSIMEAAGTLTSFDVKLCSVPTPFR